MLLNAVPALDLYSTSETRSNQKSFGLNYQKIGKELMSQDGITVMDGVKCIYQLWRVRLFLSDKKGLTPLSWYIHLPPSITVISSWLISSLPVF